MCIVLFALLPFQFSWAAVAPYFGHEPQSSVEYFGHHAHKHDANVADVTSLSADLDVVSEVGDIKASNTVDHDCSHCHSTCGMAWSSLVEVPVVSTTMADTAFEEIGGSHHPTRPERPQWLPLA